LWLLFGVIQLIDAVRRYRLAAKQWMARPGARRILKYNMRLRMLGIERPLPFQRFDVSARSADQGSRSRKRRVSRATESPLSRRLKQLAFLGLLTFFCIAYFEDFQPTHPVSSAFGFLFIGLFAALGISLAIDLAVGCRRGSSAAERSRPAQLWMEYWKSRVESFEMPRNDLKV